MPLMPAMRPLSTSMAAEAKPMSRPPARDVSGVKFSMTCAFVSVGTFVGRLGRVCRERRLS
jgi:hypothetical protein